MRTVDTQEQRQKDDTNAEYAETRNVVFVHNARQQYGDGLQTNANISLNLTISTAESNELNVISEMDIYLSKRHDNCENNRPKMRYRIEYEQLPNGRTYR